MEIELFTRPGCHLCEAARQVILAERRGHPFHLTERNVEDRPDWEEAYGRDIPVVLIDGRKAFKHRVEPRALRRYLERA